MAEELKLDEEKGTVDEPELTELDDEELERMLIEPDEPVQGEEEPSRDQEEEKPQEGHEQEPSEEDATPAGPAEEDELAKLKKQLEEKEKFIQRQGTEIGSLRKIVAELKESTEKLWQKPAASTADGDIPDEDTPAEEMIYKDPAAVIDARIAFTKAREAMNRQKIMEAVPDITNPEYLEKLADVARESGDSETVIAAFKADPFMFNPDAVIELKRRLEEKNKTSEADQLRAQLAEMQKKLEALTGAEEKMNEQIKKVANEPAVLDAGSGQGSSTDVPEAISEEQLASLSDAELDEFLKKHGR